VQGQLQARRAPRHRPPRPALVAADFNADGAADLAALADGASDGATSPIAAVLLGDGSLGFSAISYFGPDLVADADRHRPRPQRLPDLLASSQRGDAVRALLGDGRGGFGPVVTIPVGPVGHNARAADLDGDGRHELLSFGPRPPASPSPARRPAASDPASSQASTQLISSAAKCRSASSAPASPSPPRSPASGTP
jgi:hypothetical protein